MMPRAMDIVRKRCGGSAPTIFEVVCKGKNRNLLVFDESRAQRRLGHRLARTLRSPDRMRAYAPWVNGCRRPALHAPESAICWLRLPSPSRLRSMASHPVRQRIPELGASCSSGPEAHCTGEAGNRRPWRDGCHPDRRVIDLDTGPGRRFRLRCSIDPCPIPMAYRKSVIRKQLRITLFDRIC